MKSKTIHVLLFSLICFNQYLFGQDKRVLFPIVHNELWGYINCKGAVVIKPQYKVAGQFSEGLAPVRLNGTYGYINTKGEYVLPSKYDLAMPFKQGEAEVNIAGEPFFINKKGMILPQQSDKSISKSILFVNDSNSRSVIKDTENTVQPLLNFTEITPFYNKCSFARKGKGTWSLINKSGEKLSDSTFSKIAFEFDYSYYPSSPFQDGVAFVELSGGWCTIDTLGKILTQPQSFDFIKYSKIVRKGKFLFLLKDVYSANAKSPYLYGFYNSENRVLVKPTYQYIDMSNYNDSLLQVTIDDKIGYITPYGEQAWIEKKTDTTYKKLNIDFMNRGYFYASSKYIESLSNYGGWGTSDNQSKSSYPFFKSSKDTFRLLVDTSQNVKYGEKYIGMRVYVVNTTKDTLFFDAQDSRLSMNLQAKDKNGTWKDIEYLPSSWCGNSYHTLFLASNELWEFTAPAYNGEFATKIRVKLLYKKFAEQQKGNELYSNEIDGSVNPGQFWNKEQYFPNGIMDPYND